MTIPSYPKIYNIPSNYIPHLFDSKVEITEKIDGSMFAFGLDENKNVVMRSKGKELFFDFYDKNFKEIIDYIKNIENTLKTNYAKDTYFYGEYLRLPKHNSLKYSRLPKNHLMIFGQCTEKNLWVTNYDLLKINASILGFETVPLLFRGAVSYERKDELTNFLTTDSVLGESKIEGIVIKNYLEPCRVGGGESPSFGKLVSKKFREVNKDTWVKQSKNFTLEEFIASFKTEARWLKAIQHLRDSGELLEDVKDIGKLITEIRKDVIEEEEENIKQFLFNLYKDNIVRKSIGGFPEFYKEYLFNIKKEKE